MHIKEIYRENILDHYRNPHHFRNLTNPNFSYEQENAVCGDKVKLELYVPKNIIEEIGFQGVGCSLCIASASMLTDIMDKKNLAEAQKITYDILACLAKEAPLHILENYGDMRVFGAFVESPNRIQCVMLAWQCLEQSIQNWISQRV